MIQIDSISFVVKHVHDHTIMIRMNKKYFEQFLILKCMVLIGRSIKLENLTVLLCVRRVLTIRANKWRNLFTGLISYVRRIVSAV